MFQVLLCISSHLLSSHYHLPLSQQEFGVPSFELNKPALNSTRLFIQASHGCTSRIVNYVYHARTIESCRVLATNILLLPKAQITQGTPLTFHSNSSLGLPY